MVNEDGAVLTVDYCEEMPSTSYSCDSPAVKETNTVSNNHTTSHATTPVNRSTGNRRSSKFDFRLPLYKVSLTYQDEEHQVRMKMGQQEMQQQQELPKLNTEYLNKKITALNELQCTTEHYNQVAYTLNEASKNLSYLRHSLAENIPRSIH